MMTIPFRGQTQITSAREGEAGKADSDWQEKGRGKSKADVSLYVVLWNCVILKTSLLFASCLRAFVRVQRVSQKIAADQTKGRWSLDCSFRQSLALFCIIISDFANRVACCLKYIYYSFREYMCTLRCLRQKRYVYNNSKKITAATCYLIYAFSEAERTTLQEVSTSIHRILPHSKLFLIIEFKCCLQKKLLFK